VSIRVDFFLYMQAKKRFTPLLLPAKVHCMNNKLLEIHTYNKAKQLIVRAGSINQHSISAAYPVKAASAVMPEQL